MNVKRAARLGKYRTRDPDCCCDTAQDRNQLLAHCCLLMRRIALNYFAETESIRQTPVCDRLAWKLAGFFTVLFVVAIVRSHNEILRRQDVSQPIDFHDIVLDGRRLLENSEEFSCFRVFVQFE